MQLFAIIAKQDVAATSNERQFVLSFLQGQLNENAVNEYIALYDHFLEESRPARTDTKRSKRKLMSVTDSVRTLSIAKQISKTLDQRQKVVVLIRLFELIKADENFTPQRMQIIDTVADVFNISKEEYQSITEYMVVDEPELIDNPDIIFIGHEDRLDENIAHGPRHISTESYQGLIMVLRVQSVNLYILRQLTQGEVYLNGAPLLPQRVYLFPNGNLLKPAKGKPIFYTDVTTKYYRQSTRLSLSFHAEDIEYHFPNGHRGLQPLTVSESEGKLVGIMGSSGAGKTTLLNVLSGLDKPSQGQVLINGFDINGGHESLEGIVGYIPQDDFLIEELSVFDNLYFNAQLCFRDLKPEEIRDRVMSTLHNLELDHISHLRVGSPLDKTISGGQRKRLNIALELIREPSVLFVDEPTSGLSSRDSQNVMELLRELSIRGKLIFVVIHQPSSDIYKMFDDMYILDVGGHLVYSGNPVEAVMYFKRMSHQINADEGECLRCGTVKVEQIFDIIDAKEVDDFGRLTSRRKVQASEWGKFYKQYLLPEKGNAEKVEEEPQGNLSIPNRLKQSVVFFWRDLKTKLQNSQYLTLVLLEAPALAAFLAAVIRVVTESGDYVYYENQNIPSYLFMCVIVMLFLGLTVSAEEIFRDRKIRRRESFLNLSRMSYLGAKISILLLISAYQAFTFTLVGNLILGIQGAIWTFWLVLFATAFFANTLGLNISSAFNSVITIYILIPILLIPQMILSGAFFSFDKLNPLISSHRRVPIIADIMVSRWAMETLAVELYKNNRYNRHTFPYERFESVATFNQSYLIPELRTHLNEAEQFVEKSTEALDEEEVEEFAYQLTILKNEFRKQSERQAFAALSKLHIDSFNLQVAEEARAYLKELEAYYQRLFNSASRKKEERLEALAKEAGGTRALAKMKKRYANDQLETFVRNLDEAQRMVLDKGEYIQKMDPVFKYPEIGPWLNYRAHFKAPKKPFAGRLWDTFEFNVAMIFFFSFVLIITLYFESLRWLVELPNRIQQRRQKKR
jgi:ABC-type multidrug transport system ATPase subunit